MGKRIWVYLVICILMILILISKAVSLDEACLVILVGCITTLVLALSIEG